MLRMFLWVSIGDVDLACLLVLCLVWLHEMNEVSSLSVLGLLGEEFMFVFFTSLVKCSTKSIWSWIEFFFFLIVCLFGWFYFSLFRDVLLLVWSFFSFLVMKVLIDHMC